MKIKALILSILLILISCQPQFTPQKELNCYVPPPVLDPKPWNGTPIDTTSNDGRLEYLSIDNIESINTEKDEFDLEFYANKALLTRSEDVANQEVIKLFKVTNNDFNERKPLDLLPGPSGFPTIYKDDLYFSAIPAYLTENEINYFKSLSKDENLRIPKNKEDGRSRIFYANFTDDKIQNPTLSSLAWDLEIEDFDSHAAFSPNGDFVFFTSSKGHPHNGMDLYYAEVTSQMNLKKAVNIKTVNSIYEELSPFISADGKYLYFSANGEISVGGYDIYRSEINPEFWKNPDSKYFSKPQNIGAPINTSFNELFPSSSGKIDELLYYSSDQPGGKGRYDMWVFHKVKRDTMKYADDIEKNIDFKVDVDLNIDKLEENEIDLPFEPLITKSESKTFSLTGKVVDDKNNPIPDADIIVEELPEGKIQIQTKTDADGDYDLVIKKGDEIKVTADNKEDFYDSYIITKEEQDSIGSYKRDIKLDLELTIRINFPYNVFDSPYEFLIDEKGKETKEKWESEINNIADNLKNSLSKLDKIILVGHTDPVGSDSYNYELGLNRVKFIIKELASRGIPENLMEFSSKGKREPLEKFAIESKEQYHRRLRRVSLEKVYKEK